MKRLILVTLLLAAMLLLIIPAAADNDFPYLTDEADLLSSSEEAQIERMTQDLSERLQCKVALMTYRSDLSYDNFIGTDFLSRYGMSASDDLILLIVKQEGGFYYYDLYLYGMGERMIAEEEVDPLLDDENVFNNLKSGRIEAGLRGFLNAVEPLCTNETLRPNPYWRAFPVALLISLAVGVILCVIVKVSYTMKRKSVDYPLDRYAKLELTEQSDVFTGTHVTRRKISSDSGSSGGSRGGGRGHAGGR